LTKAGQSDDLVTNGMKFLQEVVVLLEIDRLMIKFYNKLVSKCIDDN